MSDKNRLAGFGAVGIVMFFISPIAAFFDYVAAGMFMVVGVVVTAVSMIALHALKEETRRPRSRCQIEEPRSGDTDGAASPEVGLTP